MNTGASAGDQTAASSKHTLSGVWSPQLRNRRDVDIYLPSSYAEGVRHPVVYMQDGQNLSDPSMAFAGTWQLEPVLLELSAKGIAPIVVGVHNTSDRLAEYSPFPDQKKGGGQGDAYLSFLIDTLKPRIDRFFRTRRLASQTAIVGSSMGGLISLYGWFRRPDVFGLAAAMSPALWYGRARLFDFVENCRLPQGRLYVDAGMLEGESMLRDARVLKVLLDAKAISNKTRLAYLEDPTGSHDEAAWGRRLGGALEFLLSV